MAVELVIKIPEEMYKWVYDVNKFSDDYGTGDFIDLIKNGTTLDNLRAEIKEIKKDTMYKYVGDFRHGVDTVIDILKKYRK